MDMDMNMTWPSLDRYQIAVQSPQNFFRDPRLKDCDVERRGVFPTTRSGNFGTVYKFIEKGGKEWAVKVFTKDAPQRQERYTLISQDAGTTHMRHLLWFEYQPEGILIDGQWFPLVLMEWGAGDTLLEYCKQAFEDIGLGLENDVLCRQWTALVTDLQSIGIAHGDLQHGNLLTNGKTMCLVDYDGMYVPSMKGQDAPELGLPAYQHPQRDERFFNPQLDDFSAMLILFQLMILDERLWKAFHHNDGYLLLDRPDLERPNESELLRNMERSPDRRVKNLARMVIDACLGELKEVPPFSHVVHEIERPLQENISLSREEEIPKMDPPAEEKKSAAGWWGKSAPLEGNALPSLSSLQMAQLQPESGSEGIALPEAGKNMFSAEMALAPEEEKPTPEVKPAPEPQKENLTSPPLVSQPSSDSETMGGGIFLKGPSLFALPSEFKVEQAIHLFGKPKPVSVPSEPEKQPVSSDNFFSSALMPESSLVQEPVPVPSSPSFENGSGFLGESGPPPGRAPSPAPLDEDVWGEDTPLPEPEPLVRQSPPAPKEIQGKKPRKQAKKNASPYPGRLVGVVVLSAAVIAVLSLVFYYFSLQEERELKNPDWRVRKSAVERMGEKESRRSVPILCNTLSDENREVRKAAAFALFRIDSERGISELAKRFGKQANTKIRMWAAEMLEEVSAASPSSAIFLAKIALEDTDAGVRKIALESLGGNASSQDIIELATKSLLDPDFEVSRTAMEFLKKGSPQWYKDEKTIAFLQEAMENISPEVRRKAVEILGQTGSTDAVLSSLAKTVLKDKEAMVQWAAVDALMRLEARRAIRYLLPGITDKDEKVRDIAENALKKIDSQWYDQEEIEAHFPILIKGLASDYKEVRQTVAKIMEKMKPNPSMMEALLNLFLNERQSIQEVGELLSKNQSHLRPLVLKLAKGLVHDDVEVQKMSFSLFREIGKTSESEEILEILIKGLQSKGEGVRRGCAELLGNMGPRAQKAIPSLIKTMLDPNQEVHRASYAALEKIDRRWKKNKMVVSSFGMALKDEDPLIRKSALSTIMKLGPDALPLLPSIESSTKDDHPEVAAEAIDTLLEIDKTRGLAVLSRYASGEEEGKQYLAKIEAVLKDGKLADKLAAAKAIEKIGPAAKSSVPLLFSALEDKDGNPKLKAVCLHTLSRLDLAKEDSLFEKIAQHLLDKNGDVQKEAVRFLNKLDAEWYRKPGVFKCLTRALRSEDADVRANATKWIQSISKK